ncbi:MAG TPA: multidrug ABC transporter ATP-binding protein [Lachnospiraceae bacterium]|nr:multidrug ABC transporter ATP-binding protein [Lachnospiraceae bacterium]HCR41111.1 multidrug ABC transporter ATP-binding protein [Lachnospiraceae bacterium]
MGVSGEKAKDFKGTMKKLTHTMARYKIGFAIVLLFAVGSTIFSIIGPTVLGNATTKISEGIISKISGGPGVDFTALGKILVTLIILYAASSVFSYIQGLIMTAIAHKVTYQFRKDISEKLHRLPMNFFDKMSHGEILSRVTNDVDTLSQSLNQSLTQLITSGISIIGILIMMIRINLSMTLLALLIVPVSVTIMSIVVKKSQKYFTQQQEYLGHVNGQVEEVYGGHTIIKAFNKEEDVLQKFNEHNEKLYESAWKSQFLSGLMHPVMSFVSNLGYVGVAILGGYLTIHGKIQIGQIQSFFQYIRNFTMPITQLSQVANMFQSTAAAAERVFEFLEADEELPTTATPLVTTGLEGNVEFQNVRFGYTPDKIIIHDFSAKVSKGQKIAIVGPTGAGKTTMVKLLMRFYDINSGQILIDGHNVNDFDRSELRKMFGMVLQDTWLFNGTIMDNIRYSRLDASDEEVIKAAKAAHVHHFISTLPDGYQMVLNEEASNVSQGQKQLLTIARAILADPKILILDEATSSVDTRTEILIQKAMDSLMKGRTSFIIAHRLSTIRDADLILVMNEGDIVEQGNHKELLAKGGFYAKLYNSQFEQTA